MNPLRIGMGAAVWAAVLAVVAWSLAGRGEHSPVSRDVADQLRQYVAGQRRAIELTFDFSAPLLPGDPIFVVRQDRVRQVGEIVAVSDSGAEMVAGAIFYASAPAIGPNAQVTFHQTPNSVTWILATMLPEDKRRAVADELRDAFAAYQQEILAAIRPVVEETTQRAYRVVEQDLPAAVQRRRERLEEIGDRYQQEIVQRELAPLVRDEIWPIVRGHTEPVVNEVGREIWQRASLWRFGWRYAYDRSPLPEKNLIGEEWQRFVQQDAVPVLEHHLDDFVAIQQKILADVARNAAVRAKLRSSLGRVLDDPEVRQIVEEIVREVVVENPRMRAALEEQWRSEQTRAALQIVAARLEPTAVRVGQLLLGTPEEGITPEFARVLRSQILGKDRRWLVLESTRSDSVASRVPTRLPVRFGGQDALHPFVREPLRAGMP